VARPHLERLEALVTDAARGAGLRCEDTTCDGEVRTTLHLDPAGADASLRCARLWATGGGAYGLALSDGYGIVDFAYDDDELEVLKRLVAVAREHLLGRGEEAEHQLSWGRRRSQLEVVVDGDVHRLTGAGPARPVPPWTAVVARRAPLRGLSPPAAWSGRPGGRRGRPCARRR